MKSLPCSFFSLLVILVFAHVSCAQETKPVQSEQAAVKAKTIIRQLAQGKFDSVVLSFDQKMKAAANTATLAQIWKQQTGNLGGFINSRTLGSKDFSGFTITRTMCIFSGDSIITQLVFDSAMYVTGLSFPSAKPTVYPYTLPTYSDSTRFTEQEVKIGSLGLPGTLTVPKGKGPFRAIVLVQGSGPHDRDESIGPNKPFKDIAWGLGSKGIAVLRYDKRTFAKQSSFTPGKPYTVKEEVTDDALSAAEFLRSTKNIDPKHVYLLGHSLGALLAPRIAKQDQKLAGIVMMAAPAQPFEDLLAKQMTYLSQVDPVHHKDDQAKGEKIKNAIKSLTQKDYYRDTLIFYCPPSYWLDLKGYLPQEVAADLTMPILVMQGGRDYQVTEDNFILIKEKLRNKRNVKFQYYKPLNHLFIEGKGPGTPAEYETAGHVLPEVIEDIVKWVGKK